MKINKKQEWKSLMLIDKEFLNKLKIRDNKECTYHSNSQYKKSLIVKLKS